MAKRSSKVKCFIVSPIGDENTPIRERASRVLEYIIRPAVKKAGYQPVRADEIALPGLIIHQIIELLIDAPLVIADLTGGSPNVFYEIAIRHAADRPIIHMIEADERLPFDVSQFRAVTFRHDDLKSADAARKQILDQVRALEANPTQAYNPVSLTRALIERGRSTEPARQVEGQILARLEDLRGTLAGGTDAAGRASGGTPPAPSVARLRQSAWTVWSSLR